MNTTEFLRSCKAETAIFLLLKDIYSRYTDIMDELLDTEEKRKVIGIIVGDAMALGFKIRKNMDDDVITPIYHDKQN